MRTIIIMISLAIATTCNAETYKWEDAQGMHFTENAGSIPKKYRAKALAEASGDITTRDPGVAREVSSGVSRNRTREKVEQARVQTEERKKANTIVSFDEWKKTFPGASSISDGQLRGYYDKTIVPNEIYRTTGNSKPLEDMRRRDQEADRDQQQRDTNSKIDRIERKLRGGI